MSAWATSCRPRTCEIGNQRRRCQTKEAEGASRAVEKPPTQSPRMKLPSFPELKAAAPWTAQGVQLIRQWLNRPRLTNARHQVMLQLQQPMSAHHPRRWPELMNLGCILQWSRRCRRHLTLRLWNQVPRRDQLQTLLQRSPPPPGGWGLHWPAGGAVGTPRQRRRPLSLRTVRRSLMPQTLQGSRGGSWTRRGVRPGRPQAVPLGWNPSAPQRTAQACLAPPRGDHQMRRGHFRSRPFPGWMAFKAATQCMQRRALGRRRALQVPCASWQMQPRMSSGRPSPAVASTATGSTTPVSSRVAASSGPAQPHSTS
mmetsp:Transcript_83799/g.187075  ORF Transcript_83799/g.187075 Transcript_83799/m.187075 type:complete len:312 (-) Transcript_83799:137-1072(-)